MPAGTDPQQLSGLERAERRGRGDRPVTRRVREQLRRTCGISGIVALSMGSDSARGLLLWLAVTGAVLLTVFLAFALAANHRRADGVHPAQDSRQAIPAPDWERSLQIVDTQDEPPPESSWATDTVFTSVRTARKLETVRVRGSFVLIDGQGAEHLHEDGRFELSVWGPRTRSPLHAPRTPTAVAEVRGSAAA